MPRLVTVNRSVELYVTHLTLVDHAFWYATRAVAVLVPSLECRVFMWWGNRIALGRDDVCLIVDGHRVSGEMRPEDFGGLPQAKVISVEVEPRHR